MIKRLSVFWGFASALLLAGAARGEIIVNTFGPRDSFNASRFTGILWNVYEVDSYINLGQSVAIPFSVSGKDYSFASLTLALGNFSGTNNLKISIVQDNSGTPTGPVVEVLATHPSNIVSHEMLVTYDSLLNPVLSNGRSYWLVAEPEVVDAGSTANNAWFGWYAGQAGGTVYLQDFNFSQSSWNPWLAYLNEILPAFRIEGTLVPEPSSVGLLILGACIGVLSRRKRRAVDEVTRQTTSAPASAPLPGSY